MRPTTWFVTTRTFGVTPYPFPLRTSETLDRIELGGRVVGHLRRENGRWTR